MHEPTELPEPFRSLLYDLEKPLPADFPKEMQRSSFDEMFEGMPEDLRPNLPKPLLDELTKSIFDESMKATIEDSKDILPDEYLQTLLDEFNRTLPDDTPRPPRDQAIQHLRYTLIKQQIDGNQNLFDDCRQILLDQYRKLEYDEYRQFIRDGHHKSLANGFPQRVLEMWRRLYPGIRDKFSTLKPEVDEMCDVAEQVQAVIQLLCERDERFSFIHSALEEFVNGHDGLQDCQESVDRIDSTDPNELEDFVAMDKLSEILTWPISRRKRDPADMMNLKGALHEIIDSTIYELLDVFRDIKIEQPSIGTSLMTHFDLLYDLYRKSELSTPQPAIQVTPKPREDSANETSYQYPSRLNSAIGEVRTIKILPSTRKERIECHLVVRNLYHDDIPEALSYVWGKDMSTEKILVDHKPFTVTNNLLKILRDLRRLDITREIWIDAICINQSDFNEKTDQVQLMKEIYSRAKNTVIWLSGAHTESKQIEVSVKNQGEYPVENQRADQSFNMEGLYAPIPVGLGGVDIDQYDLAAILKESLKYSMDAPCAEDPAGPSWVLDFTYTDAGFRGNKSIRETKHKVTLDGFISENNLSHLKLEDGADNMCLCTPTTLFCTGHYIDQVRWVGLMPRLSDAATLTAFTVLTSLTLEVFNTRESLLGIPATTEFGDDVNTEFLSITHFLLMQNNEPLDLENLDELANIRNQELVGKPVFITEKGLVGIATALIKPGDSLSWIHGSPIYLILREVENRDNSSDDVRQDCIVARAAVNDKLIHGKKNMKDLIYSTPSLPFQIV
ncbi:Heterokaryon incompatibility protein 6, OR allele [Daldinia childiae]|uniref:Heterokaryon incompatibility protein 6, OR allele n=1 Tax=Daldinia childiae TaxID=326645 RepID=UPI001448752C|nr:Heterokaryon incompatibility protein 6, OR allele [Daldinia childiae]KAF3055927.1 Heterokaryon incompatibility protein 6, OR allele [Daldinia childiae]